VLDPAPPAPHDLHELVARGDWACAHEDSKVLAEVAHLLGLCVPPPELFEVLEIERLAVVDMARASERWRAITPALRSKLFAPDLQET